MGVREIRHILLDIGKRQRVGTDGRGEDTGDVFSKVLPYALQHERRKTVFAWCRGVLGGFQRSVDL